MPSSPWELAGKTRSRPRFWSSTKALPGAVLSAFSNSRSSQSSSTASLGSQQSSPGFSGGYTQSSCLHFLDLFPSLLSFIESLFFLSWLPLLTWVIRSFFCGKYFSLKPWSWWKNYLRASCPVVDENLVSHCNFANWRVAENRWPFCYDCCCFGLWRCCCLPAAKN